MKLGRKPKHLHAYAWGVLRGTIPAGKLVRQACERSLRDHRTAKRRDLEFRPSAAANVVDFFGFLKHSKGEWAGLPFVLSPWQEWILSECFGWYRADGTRRFREVYIEVARKNGKTSWLAGIGLYLCGADGEPGAEVYTIATKFDQAKIMHGEATRMVQASEFLSGHYGVLKNNIHVVENASKYEPLGADSKTLDGLNAHGILADELHAHPNSELLDVMVTSTGSRRQPLTIEITTAGSSQVSLCFQQHEYAEQILSEALTDDTFFAFIASLDEGDDWTDESVWVKANPNLGVSVKLDALRDDVAQAMQSPQKQNSVRRLRLNQWTRATTRFLDLAAWDANAGEIMPGEIERAALGRVVYGGLDLASVGDVTALVLVVPPADLDKGLFDVICRFWLPDHEIRERSLKARVPYDQWAREGWLLTTEGDVTDYAAIRNEIAVLADRHRIAEIDFDPWNAAGLVSDLMNDGIPMVKQRPGIALSGSTKVLERFVLSKRLRHGGHPVLRWMADNLQVKSDNNGNVWPIKPDHSMSHRKIDGQVALIMALGAAEAGARVPAPEPSVYESRGIRFI